MIKKIFLDQDGVLANFVGAVAEVFETTEEYLIDNWDLGEYDVCKVLKISTEELWGRIDNKGEDYWTNMKSYPWAKVLFMFCDSIAPTVILTSPSYNPSCLSGKVKWMNKNLPEIFDSEHQKISFRDFMISPKKEMAAAPGHLLIDDSESQCQKWTDNGGQAIIFPRVWNHEFESANDPIKYLEDQLEKQYGFKLQRSD